MKLVYAFQHEGELYLVLAESIEDAISQMECELVYGTAIVMSYVPLRAATAWVRDILGI